MNIFITELLSLHRGQVIVICGYYLGKGYYVERYLTMPFN